MAPPPMSWPDRVFGFLALALIVSMSGILLVLNPGDLFRLMVGIVGVMAGSVFLFWLWGWRYPRRRRHVERLVQAAREAAQQRTSVVNATWWGTLGGTPNILVRMDVRSDADRETLMTEEFRATVTRLAAAHGFGAAQVQLVVDSHETVDRDFGGDWWTYYH